MFEFNESEWKAFTHTEKSMIILARKHDVKTHESMRHWLHWPVPGQMNKRTYEGHWSRLQKKMRKINACRKDAVRLRLEHADADERGARDPEDFRGHGGDEPGRREDLSATHRDTGEIRSEDRREQDQEHHLSV